MLKGKFKRGVEAVNWLGWGLRAWGEFIVRFGNVIVEVTEFIEANNPHRQHFRA